MIKLTLEELQGMCKLSLDKTHVQEVLNTIAKSKFCFHPGIVQPQERIASLYKLRLEILKENGRGDLDFLDDYEKTVANLQQSGSPNLAITTVSIQDGGFVIFYEPDTKTILGVIKGKSSSDIPIDAHQT